MSGIARIHIEQQYAQIEIKTVMARMKIQLPDPQMEITQELPQMEVTQERPEFDLNWDRVWAESGRKKPTTLALSNRDIAFDKTMRAINETIQDGNYLGKPEIGGNRVSQLARQKNLRDAGKTINIGLMPQSSPEINWKKGYINVEWTKGEFKVEWHGADTMAEVILDPPHSVEIVLSQRPYIKITVTEELMAEMGTLGKNIDKVI